MIRRITATNNESSFGSRRGRVFFGLIFMALMCLASVERINAQRVYGVAARSTTVVSNGSSTAVVRRTTVVAGTPHAVALPSGYIAVLPAGYRVVGGGFYMVGGMRYRATFYHGRTVYVRV